MSSEVFERCKEELASFVSEYRGKTANRLKNASQYGEQDNNRVLSDSEQKVEQAYRNIQTMNREISVAPAEFRTTMNAKVRTLQRDVDTINRELKTIRTNQRMQRGGFDPSSNAFDSRADINTLEERQRQQVMFGTDMLDRASESVLRTQRVAAENEQIGVEVLGELGTQREQLQRTSRKLDDTKAELSRSRKLLNTMHRRVITNKILLIGIIVFEVIILLALIYIKFIS